MKCCLECGKALPVDAPAKRKLCNQACSRAYRRFSPKHADRFFWPKVSKAPHPKGCWLWYKHDPIGYGRFLKSGPYAYAHRTAWLLTNGPIPDGMEVAHRCDTRNCCNPAHFFLATHDENMADCKAKGRHIHGVRNWKSKLTDAQIIEIKRDFHSPKNRKSNAKALAAKYGVRIGAIYSIVRGVAWTHVTHSGDQR